jgi:hypothetical protein
MRLSKRSAFWLPQNMHFTSKSRFKESKEYISKIAQIILRDRIQSDNSLRTRTKSDTFQELSLLHSRTKSEPTGLKEFPLKETVHIHSLAIEHDFWRQGIPIHIDLVGDNGFIIERWILSFTIGYVIFVLFLLNRTNFVVLP